MTFYNTTNETGRTLKKAEAKVKSQNKKILEFYKKNPKTMYGPSAVWELLFSEEDVPLTSVRRAITNLTEKGKLMKTTTKRTGAYEANEYCWQLNHTEYPLNIQLNFFD